MKKSAGLLSVGDALAALLQGALPLTDIEQVDTLDAHQRVLAKPVYSTLNVPPADNSQMDGFAVRASDCLVGKHIAVSQRIPAGHPGKPLAPGTAARIFTGGLIPPGADCVVMQEQCDTQQNEHLGTVAVKSIPQVGEWIRTTGEDIKAGAVILDAGLRLRAQDIGLAASAGVAQLSVMRKLRVAIFFTGDELAMPGEPLKPGAIYNSNRFMLRGLLNDLGCDVSDFGTTPDALPATQDVLRSAALEHDLILSCGGVSVGEEDHVKTALEAEGSLALWRIAIKPGKPLASGTVTRKAGGATPFIGLPGNPVSSFVGFLVFVRPFIQKLQGAKANLLAYQMARADFDWPKADGRTEFLRVKRNEAGGLDAYPNQNSSVLSSTVWGDGFVEVPPNSTFTRGALVKYISFTDLTR